MTDEEWQRVAEAVNRQVAGIIASQRLLSEIHEELDSRAVNPTEEDFIDRDAYGGPLVGPRVSEIGGVTVRVWKLHRRGNGSRDIKGADLLYEIEDHKFVLIQTKLPSRGGRVSLDRGQLDTLRGACPVTCAGANMQMRGCASWHVVVSDDGSTYHQACQAEAIFNGASSRRTDYFRGGLAKDAFDLMFANCLLGAPTTLTPVAQHLLAAYHHGHALFLAYQQGSF